MSGISANSRRPVNSWIRSDHAQHLAPAEAEHRAVQEDIVLPGELGIEARSHLDQGGDVAADRHLAGRRGIDPGQEPQQRALAGAVAADDAHAVAGLDLERDVAQGPELGAGHRRLPAQQQVEDGALERILLVGVVDEPKRDVVQLDQPGPAAAWRSAGPRRSESKDHLVFLRLEYGIADSQARRRDHGRGRRPGPTRGQRPAYKIS